MKHIPLLICNFFFGIQFFILESLYNRHDAFRIWLQTSIRHQQANVKFPDLMQHYFFFIWLFIFIWFHKNWNYQCNNLFKKGIVRETQSTFSYECLLLWVPDMIGPNMSDMDTSCTVMSWKISLSRKHLHWKQQKA